MFIHVLAVNSNQLNELSSAAALPQLRKGRRALKFRSTKYISCSTIDVARQKERIKEGRGGEGIERKRKRKSRHVTCISCRGRK